MKKIGILFTLIISCCLALAGVNFFAPNVASVSGASTELWTYINGNGSTTNLTYLTGAGSSQEAPYQIRTADELARLSAFVNQGGDTAGKFFKVMNDIDLSANLWEPIGTHQHPFKGAFFSADNVSIIGMTINTFYLGNGSQAVAEDSIENLGLFGYVAGNTAIQGVIKGITLANAKITVDSTATTNTVGALVGQFYGAQNVTTTAGVEKSRVISQGNEVSEITTNRNLGDSGTLIIGGLIGILGNGCSVTTDKDTLSFVNITSKEPEKTSASLTIGGVIGQNNGTVSAIGRNGGKITAKYGAVGGVIGINTTTGVATNIYHKAQIEVNPATTVTNVYINVGGLIGINQGAVANANFATIFPTANGNFDTELQSSYVQTTDGNIGGLVGNNRAGSLNGLINFAEVRLGLGDGTVAVKNIGGIAGINTGNLTDCINNGSLITNMSGSVSVENAGGIAGVVQDNGVLIGCQNNGKIFSEIGAKNAGGLIGRVYEAGSSSYKAITSNVDTKQISFNTAEVNATICAGGLVGKITNNYIYSAYNTGHVFGRGSNPDNVGGLIGANENSEMFYCFNNGNITNGGNVGGLIGKQTNGGNIRYCYNTGIITGSATGNVYLGGLIGRLINGNVLYNYSIGKIVDSRDISNITTIGGIVGKQDTSAEGGNSVLMDGDRVVNFYSTSIANYTIRNLVPVGNYPTAFAGQQISYEMTLPQAENLVTGFINIFNSTEFTFTTAELENNKYFYPVLSWFNTNIDANIYSKTAMLGKITIPSEIIYKVEYYNYLPTEISGERTNTHLYDEYIIHGQTVVEPDADSYDTKAGYTSRWKKQASGEGEQDWDFAQGLILSNCKIYLSWTAIRYNITYMIKQGLQDYQSRVITSAPTFWDFDPQFGLELLPVTDVNVVKTGYIFDGWYTFDHLANSVELEGATATTSIIANTVYDEFNGIYVYANYTPKQYEITLNANGGTLYNNISTVNIFYDDDTFNIAPAIWIDATKKFKGWYTSTTGESNTRYTDNNGDAIKKYNIDANITFYALYMPLNPVMTFVDPENISWTWDNMTVSSGTTVTLAMVNSWGKLKNKNNATGYNIENIYINAGLTTQLDSVHFVAEENTTLYVKWQPASFTLTLNANGGIAGDTTTIQVQYGGLISSVLNNLSNTQKPTRVGYDFGTWTNQDGSIIGGDTIMGVEGFTAFAKWNVLNYTLTISSNGGVAGTLESLNVEFGSPILTAINALSNTQLPNRQNYGIKGWSFNSDINYNNMLTSAITMPAESRIIYAIWKRTYTVTFEYDFTGENVVRQTVFENEAIVEPVARPNLVGFTFVSWRESTRAGSKLVYGDVIKFDGDLSPTLVDGNLLVSPEMVLDTSQQPAPEDNTQTLLIVAGALVGIIVVLFIVMFTRKKYNEFSLRDKSLQTEENKKRIEELKNLQSTRRADNPFDDM